MEHRSIFQRAFNAPKLRVFTHDSQLETFVLGRKQYVRGKKKDKLTKTVQQHLHVKKIEVAEQFSYTVFAHRCVRISGLRIQT